MPQVLQMSNGRPEVIVYPKDFEDLIDKYMGAECANYYQNQIEQLSECIKFSKERGGCFGMIAIKFKEANKNLLKPESMTDEECGSLWVYSDGRQCISCWRLTWKERIKALIFGKVWLSVLSGYTQPPVWLACDDTVFVKEGK